MCENRSQKWSILGSYPARVWNLKNLSKEINESEYNSSQKPINFKKLQLDNISFTFFRKEKKNIIDKISMEIEKGQAVGITGPSGSGKTTLINIILGLY